MNAREGRIMELVFADILPVRRDHIPGWLETPMAEVPFRKHILDDLFKKSPCCKWGSSINDGQEMFVVVLNYIGRREMQAILGLAEELDLDWFISVSGRDDSKNTIRLTFTPRVCP